MKVNTTALLVFAFALLPFCSYGQWDSFSVYFQSGVTVLNDEQTQYLDSMLYTGTVRPGDAINITGYADEPGTTVLNKSIAMRRADAVKVYLLSSGIESSQIVACAGLGNLVRSGDDMHQRRVDIVLGRMRVPASTSAGKPEAAPKAGPALARKRSLRDLKTMKAGELMVIENLQFKVSTDVFEPVSLPVLQELADVLQDFPGVNIRLEGHICCGGKADSSDRLAMGYKLSLFRAQAVLKYLTSHGISSSRLSCTGFGFSRPKVFPERGPEDSYINRRVEIRVVTNK
jgi:outer membrane protein OmpA-like peptidoglycan-associated protein